MPKKKVFILILVTIVVLIGAFLILSKTLDKNFAINIINDKKTMAIEADNISTVVEQKMASSSPVLEKSATLSAEEMNKLYGPCIKLNVLMYHHIEEEKDAKEKNQTSLNVTPDFFRKHLEYLRDKKYQIIEAKDLVAFFNGTAKLSPKSVLITLDDAYDDNYKYAYPLLKEFGYKAIIFTPIGLVDNSDYLNWNQIREMKDLVYFGNHTWSHHPASNSKDVMEKEIGLADAKLAEHGLNNVKIFAYPYGGTSVEAKNVLNSKGYSLAFTTKHGNFLCKGKSLELPRIRAGNSPLSSYGL